MRFLSPTNRSFSAYGFTLIEVLIIAPVVILVISGFVALMVTMTADVLVTRDQNNMAYEVQGSLDQIEQDTRLSTQFLTTSGAFTAPQGSDSNFTGTAAFTNTGGTTLILGALTTDKNPADSTRQLVYYAGQPNLCGAQQSYNRVFLAKVMYFLKGGSLWRRSVLPNYNTNAILDDDTVCSAPWQRNTCSPGYNPATRCQANDSELMKNVDSFSVKYFGTPTSTTEIGSAQALVATTIEVTLNGKKVTAGRNITTAGSVRATKLNNIDVDLPIPSTPTVTAQVNDSTSITFSWAAVPLASSYVISYNKNGGAWIDATTNSQTTTYNVSASRGDTVTIRVSARNSSGVSPYATAAATVPLWTACLQSNWTDFGAGYAGNGYTKTSDHIVALKGLIRSGNAASGTVLCTLPAGYRPSAQLVFITSTAENIPGRIDVLPNGQVIIVSGNNTWLSLDGIKFVASTAPYSWADATPQGTWVPWGGAFPPMRSTIDPTGRVHVQGLMRSGNSAAYNPVGVMAANRTIDKSVYIPTASNTAFNFMLIANSNIHIMGIDGSGYYAQNTMYYSASSSATWTDLGIGAGWVNFDTVNNPSAQYTKSADGIVTLRGMIKNGTAANGTVLATLPPGYRPKDSLVTICVAWSAYCRIDVTAGGALVIRVAHPGWTSLDGISFIAEQ